VNILRKAVETRMSFLKEGHGDNTDWTDEGEGWQNYFLTPGIKLHTLTLQEIVKNSIALSYFMDYMSGVGGNNILLMYLNTFGEGVNIFCDLNVKEVLQYSAINVHSMEKPCGTTVLCS